MINQNTFDNINIEYHIENLSSFFSMFFIHWKNHEEYKIQLKKEQDLKINERIKINKNNKKNTKNIKKGFFSYFFSYKEVEHNENKNENIIVSEEINIEEIPFFDKESYLINFPAFYYFEYKELDSLYNEFFAKKCSHDYVSILVKSRIETQIKSVIVENKLYKSAIINFKNFSFSDLVKIFKSDESIIYFFDFIKNSKINKNNNMFQDLTNYLISDIILHKHQLFDSCFSNFNFDLIPRKDLECLMTHMFLNNTAHLFLPYVSLNLKEEIEKKIMTVEIHNF